MGLAAGFDKNAEVFADVLNFGFGFVEIGTITPKPQTGNPKPRIFRSPEAQAVINRLGFNSQGLNACMQRIKAWYDHERILQIDDNIKSPRGLFGINIGANKDSDDLASDYVTGFTETAPYADYITINISSPNTEGLRDLQEKKKSSPTYCNKVNAVRRNGNSPTANFCQNRARSR